MWKLKELSDENQTDGHEIEPNPSKDRAMPEEDNPSFWDEFTKCTSYSYSKVSTEVLNSNWAVDTLGD
jgi:hypothetical protein